MVRQLIPEGLAEMAPGPELSALLAGIDIHAVTGSDLVDVLCARARQLAHDQAQLPAGLTRRRPRLAPTSAGSLPCRGGIVELHIPATLLTELATDPAAGGEWTGVVADIAAQYRSYRDLGGPVAQDPSARFAGAVLRRHIQIRDRFCVYLGCRCSARQAGGSIAPSPHRFTRIFPNPGPAPITPMPYHRPLSMTGPFWNDHHHPTPHRDPSSTPTNRRPSDLPGSPAGWWTVGRGWCLMALR